MFYTEDTTLNAWPLREILPRDLSEVSGSFLLYITYAAEVMVCTKYGTLMNLTDGGLQYLFATWDAPVLGVWGFG